MGLDKQRVTTLFIQLCLVLQANISLILYEVHSSYCGEQSDLIACDSTFCQTQRSTLLNNVTLSFLSISWYIDNWKLQGSIVVYAVRRLCYLLLPPATLPSITPQLAVVLSIVYTVYWQPDPRLFGMSMPLHLYLSNGCGLCLKKGGSPPPPYLMTVLLLQQCTSFFTEFSELS